MVAEIDRTAQANRAPNVALGISGLDEVRSRNATDTRGRTSSSVRDPPPPDRLLLPSVASLANYSTLLSCISSSIYSLLLRAVRLLGRWPEIGLRSFRLQYSVRLNKFRLSSCATNAFSLGNCA
jgi:hypothetical protein